jgi:murein DD-endopeptidase MepM/ murein hydrolase activator NlpD
VDPLAKATLLCASLAALTSAAEGGKPADAGAMAQPAALGDALSSVCPPTTLPDGPSCIPVPAATRGGSELEAKENRHLDRHGNWVRYEQIPRRPDRPEKYTDYRYPVPISKNQQFVSSGYDLDMPSASQRRGAHLKAVGHGGIDIAQPRGTEVRSIALEHQVGDAEVVLVGELFGNSVVTRHSLREGGRLREYLVVHGHLDGPAPGLTKGMNVREGSMLGFVGDSGSPGDVHLHLEVRRVRDTVDAKALAPRQMVHNAKTVVCDPRNVLPAAD